LEFEIEANEIKGIVDYLLANDIHTARFQFNARGLSFKGTDASQISLISIGLPAASFKKYEGKGEFSVDLSHFKDALNCFDKWETVELKATEEEIEVKDSSETIRIPQTVVSSEELPNPTIEPLFHAEISRLGLRTAIKHAKVFSEGIFFKYVEEEGLVAEAKSSKGKYKKIIKVKESVKNKCNKCKSFYSTDYLETLTKNLNTDTATIGFGNNTPMHLTGTIGSAYIEFWLAPRMMEIEEEETEEEETEEETPEETETVKAIAK